MSSLLSPLSSSPPLSSSSSPFSTSSLSLSSLLSSSSSSSMSGRETPLTAASIANADVSARGRSRWWDRPPSRYSRHFGAAINRRTSHQSRGTAPMISISKCECKRKEQMVGQGPVPLQPPPWSRLTLDN
ncbi:uncharacterized protein LOC117909082 [Vitis riparia]|uniref:uncharacterized protein LOC117909082 n=1 Tax=Vitis riparia TaxID=96939 RepID=UPI00155B2E85|nr:uncharacterized protein LOC117909082 [Vitis riparia]